MDLPEKAKLGELDSMLSFLKQLVMTMENSTTLKVLFCCFIAKLEYCLIPVLRIRLFLSRLRDD